MFGREYGARLGVDFRRDDHFCELTGDGFRSRLVDGDIEGDDAAKGRRGVGTKCLAIGLLGVYAKRHAAGVGVLDNDAGEFAFRNIKSLHAFPCRVGIGDVVVREFLALNLLIAGDAASHYRCFAIERRLLMRILAVTQGFDLVEGELQFVREGTGLVVVIE